MARPKTVGKKRGKGKGRVPKQYTFRGVTGTIKELHAAFPWPIGLSALGWRLRQGMSLETAFNTPSNDWQKKNGENAKKYILQYNARKAEGLLTSPPKAKKPNHPADVIAAHCGRCQSCGAVLLKQSLEDGRCKGGC